VLSLGGHSEICFSGAEFGMLVAVDGRQYQCSRSAATFYMEQQLVICASDIGCCMFNCEMLLPKRPQ